MASKGRVAGLGDRAEDHCENMHGRRETWNGIAGSGGGREGLEKEGTDTGGRARSKSSGRAGAGRNVQMLGRGRGNHGQEGGRKDDALKRLSSKQDEWLESCIQMISGLVNSESPQTQSHGGAVGGNADDDDENDDYLEGGHYDDTLSREPRLVRKDVRGGWEVEGQEESRGPVVHSIGSPNSSSIRARDHGQVNHAAWDLMRAGECAMECVRANALQETGVPLFRGTGWWRDSWFGALVGGEIVGSWYGLEACGLDYIRRVRTHPALLHFIPGEGRTLALHGRRGLGRWRQQARPGEHAKHPPSSRHVAALGYSARHARQSPAVAF